MQEETDACANNFCENSAQFTGGRLYVAFRAGTGYLVVIEIQTDLNQQGKSFQGKALKCKFFETGSISSLIF